MTYATVRLTLSRTTVSKLQVAQRVMVTITYNIIRKRSDGGLQSMHTEETEEDHQQNGTMKLKE